MTRRNVANGVPEPCPIRDVLDHIGDRWSLLVLWSLADGTLRFTELKRSIGDISQRVLAQTLRRLEQDGFVRREIYPSVPPRVDYSLTDMGRSFLRPMNGLIDWADEYQAKIRQARTRYAGMKRNLPA